MIILLRSLLQCHIFQIQAGFLLQFGIERLYVPINISYQGQNWMSFHIQMNKFVWLRLRPYTYLEPVNSKHTFL